MSRPVLGPALLEPGESLHFPGSSFRSRRVTGGPFLRVASGGTLLALSRSARYGGARSGTALGWSNSWAAKKWATGWNHLRWSHRVLGASNLRVARRRRIDGSSRNAPRWGSPDRDHRRRRVGGLLPCDEAGDPDRPGALPTLRGGPFHAWGPIRGIQTKPGGGSVFVFELAVVR